VQLADAVTTTSGPLADCYRDFGARSVHVLENYVPDAAAEVDSRGGQRVVVGWTAASEHRYDHDALRLREVLQRLLDTHPQVEVRGIGIPLGLRGDRYTNLGLVQFTELPRAVAGFDVGLAPIADNAFNRARSNVKLKEYAAAGVPWLASPIGPYAGMGEKQGGRLVPDDRWYEEIERLVLDHRGRRKLAKRAKKWGRSQVISKHVGAWEQMLKDAVAARAAAAALT